MRTLLLIITLVIGLSASEYKVDVSTGTPLIGDTVIATTSQNQEVFIEVRSIKKDIITGVDINTGKQIEAQTINSKGEVRYFFQPKEGELDKYFKGEILYITDTNDDKWYYDFMEQDFKIMLDFSQEEWDKKDAKWKELMAEWDTFLDELYDK
ncbi:MAG: hypothetical protein GXZ15_03555 [Campylobacter sp.]|nr:hypothetical protein [Campylobacter sp.]